MLCRGRRQIFFGPQLWLPVAWIGARPREGQQQEMTSIRLLVIKTKPGRSRIYAVVRSTPLAAAFHDLHISFLTLGSNSFPLIVELGFPDSHHSQLHFTVGTIFDVSLVNQEKQTERRLWTPPI